MKRALVLLVAMVAAAGPAWAQAPAGAEGSTSAAMANLAAKTQNSLAIVQFELQQEQGINLPPIAGLAICVAKGEGDAALLITTGLDPRILPESIRETKVIIPGADKTLKASYRSTDPVTGITFVDVTEAHAWTPVQFKAVDLPVGRLVMSVGLLDAALANRTYYGMGYVSAKVRVPAPMIYVTGGWLTNIGSPVFTADGTAVGMVQEQLPTPADIAAQGGPASILFRGQRETSYFMPAEEFIQVITNPPAKGKRLPWIGVLRFRPYQETLGAIGVPAVIADKVVANSPAGKVGVKDNSIITALNGQGIEKMATPQLTVLNFVRQLNRLQIGSKITLTILDQGQAKEVPIVVETFPPTPQDAKKYFSRQLGLAVRDKVELDETLDPSPTGAVPGVYVIGVVSDSPAAKAGVKTQPVDLIVSVAGQPIKNVTEFEKAVEQALTRDPRKAVTIMVRRGEVNQSLSIQPE